MLAPSNCFASQDFFFPGPDGAPRLFSHLVIPFFFFFSFCILTLCYDNNSKFINCDGFAKTSQVLGSFMTKSINCHCVMGFISIVADP